MHLASCNFACELSRVISADGKYSGLQEGVLPKLLKYSTHAGVHTQLCPSLSCCTPQKLNSGWCQEGNLQHGAGDTGDRRGAVGGVTPSPALTGNPDIGQYVATVCSAELHSCSYCCSQQEIGRPLVGRSIAAAGCPPFHHPILAQLLARFSLHTRV